MLELGDAETTTALREMLSASLGNSWSSIKKREIFLYHNVRIHLDEVSGLGTFLEFEAVVTEVRSTIPPLVAGRLASAAVRIDAVDLLSSSYSDMLMGNARLAASTLERLCPMLGSRPSRSETDEFRRRKEFVRNCQPPGSIWVSKQIELPIVVGTENENAVDISKLRAQTGYITLDEGYVNTGATTSAITFLDGEQGILRYRGYPIEVLAENCDFVEASYLLIYGELPNREQLEKFRTTLRRHTMLHEDMRLFYDGFPRDAHPMAILSSVVRSAFDVLPGLARPSRSASRSRSRSTGCWPSCRRSPPTATRSRSASRSSIRRTT